MAALAPSSLVVTPPNPVAHGMLPRSAQNHANTNAAARVNLFVGDLSTFCSEDDLSLLFSQFGQVLEVKIMKSEETKRNLAYGFVKFADTASARNALSLNGTLFQGRNMKVNWAEYRNKLNPKDEVHEELTTAPVHVSFISYQINHRVNEQSLRLLFSQFGEVKDVTIKKSNIEDDLRRQSGYGFVHFDFTREGIEAASRAAEELKDQTIDEVNYKSSLSHSLGRLLKENAPHSASTAAAAPSAANGSTSAPQIPTLPLQTVFTQNSVQHGAPFAAPPHENNGYPYMKPMQTMPSMQNMQPMQPMQHQVLFSDAHGNVSYSPVLTPRSLPPQNGFATLPHGHPHAQQMMFSHNQLSHQPIHVAGGAASGGFLVQDANNNVFLQQSMPAVHHTQGFPSPSPYPSAPIPMYHPLHVSPSLTYRVMPPPSVANAHTHTQWMSSPSMSPNLGAFTAETEIRGERLVDSLLQSPSPAQGYAISPYAPYATIPYGLDQSAIPSYPHEQWVRGNAKTPEMADRSGTSPSTSTASMPFNSDVVMSSALTKNSQIAGRGSSTRQAGNRTRTTIMSMAKVGRRKETDDQSSSETDNR